LLYSVQLNYCIISGFYIHPFEKTLSGERYKRWTMRRNGTLEIW